MLACIGDVTPEVWFAVLADYSNVSVYLPLGICDHCKTTTGEEMLGDAIATAEEWAGTGLGLEVEARDLKCVKRREYERKEFMDNMMRTTGLTVSKLNPAAAAVASVTQKLKAHSDRITQLERTLNNACGSTDFKRRRVLTQNRQLLLSALQDTPSLPIISRHPSLSAILISAPCAALALTCALQTLPTWWVRASSPSSRSIAWDAACASRRARTMRSRW